VSCVAGDAVAALADLRGFDLCLIVHTLEHVDRAAVGPLLAAARRAAAALAAEVPDVEADALNVARFALGRPYHGDADHVREYTPAALAADLAAAGWAVRSLDRRGGSVLAVAGPAHDNTLPCNAAR
jgi:hypothetical protein